MLMLAYMPPAYVQPAASAVRPFTALVEGLEEIAETYITGGEAELPARLAASRRLWEHAKRTRAQVLTDQEVQTIERSVEALPTLKGRLQAEAALGVAAMVAGHMRPTPNRARLEADLAAMLAWCKVEARSWDQVPNVAEAFKPVLEAHDGRHPEALREIGAHLGALQEDLALRSVSAAKRDLRRLLELLDSLAKP